MARQGNPPAGGVEKGSAQGGSSKETAPKRKTGAGEFIQQVRQETSKVTWPTRKETTITTIMVFIMVTLAAIFFFIVDSLLNMIVRFVLGLGG